MSDYNDPNLTDGSDFDASAMIESLNTGGSDDNKFELPEEIAGLKPEDYAKGLSVISGGAVEDFDGFRSILSKAQEYEKLQGEYSELQKKYKQNENPYANEYVKELNNLYKEGAKPEEIALFRKMQTVELDTMSDVDILKLQMSMQYPSLSKSQVEAAFDKEYGDAEDWSEGDKAMLAKQAIDAKGELSKLKFDSKTPETIRVKQQQDIAQRKAFDYWNQVEEAVGVQESFKISEKLSGDEMFEFDFKLPDGAVEHIKKARLHHLMSGSVRMGDSKAYMEEMSRFTESYVFARYGKEMLRTALEQQKSQVKLATDRKHHNVKPTPQGKDLKAPKISDALAAELDSHREKI